MHAIGASTAVYPPPSPFQGLEEEEVQNLQAIALQILVTLF